MSSALTARIILDLCMAIILLCAYAYRITGDVAYWCLPLIGVHIGLNWGMAKAGIRKMLNINSVNPVCAIIARIFVVAFVVFGIWSSFDRDMFAKLFLGFSFDYWPPERPFILFFAETLSIMGIYVFAAYYLSTPRRRKPSFSFIGSAIAFFFALCTIDQTLLFVKFV